MKFPKNRANLYLVVRGDRVVIGAFSDDTEADNFREACEQEWLDKTGDIMDFNLELTTYYG